MKFTSFAIVIISAAAMAGVVIASVDPVVPVTPANGPSPNGPNVVPCDKPVGCSKGVDGYNNGNDFGFTCASDGRTTSWMPCECKNCCHLINNGNTASCS